MTRKHILWLAPLAAAAVTILAASAPGGPAPESPRHEAERRQAAQERAAPQEDEQFVAQADEWVCAVRKVADFGTYCTYYAVHCPTLAPRSWSNTNCSLSP